MRRYFLILALLAMLLMAWVVSAQNGYPVGYQTVYTAPAAGMHPLNYTCTLTTYDASNGMAQTQVTAEVDAYIVWITPPRPAEYYLSFSQNDVRFWVIYSQQTLDALCR